MIAYRDIKKFTSKPNYHISLSWGYLQSQLNRYEEHYRLQLEPDFQRAHVWSAEQQVAYVEAMLRDHPFGRDIYFNCPYWMSSKYRPGPMVLVDGLQRLTAVQLFLNNKLLAFGQTLDEFPDKEVLLRKQDLDVYVHNLSASKEVLQWYLDMNSGGTPHTNEELDKVRRMLDES